MLFALQKTEGLSNSELAEFLEMTPATLANKVKRMEKAGLVQRRRDPEDERVCRIYLTEKGRDLIDDLRCSMDEIEAVLLYGFDELGVNRLKASLENVISNQERHASNQ